MLQIMVGHLARTCYCSAVTCCVAQG